MTIKRTAKKTAAKPRPKRTAVPKQPRVRNPKAYIAEAEDDMVLIQTNRATIARLNDEVSVAQDRVTSAFEKAKIKTHKFDRAGETYSATYSQQSRVVIDEGKLKKKIGAALWNKITTRILDRKKLEAYIASGEVSASIVAACSDEHEGKPFVKITKK